MTRIAKIALINGEIDFVLKAMSSYQDEFGLTEFEEGYYTNLNSKIEKALRKFEDNNKQVIHDVTKSRA